MQFRRPSQNASRPDNYILANVNDSEYATLSRSLIRMELPQGFLFAGPSDVMSFVYFPTAGLCSIDAITEKGESIEVGVTGREGVIGTASILGQAEIMHTVVMQMAGQGYRLPISVACDLLRQGGRFQQLIYEHVTLQMLQMSQSALCNRLHDVKSRLARWLLTASDRGDTEQVTLTQEYLSQMLGSRRSTVTVMAGELQRDRMIEYSRGKILITNRAGLEEAACECYGIVSAAYRRAIQASKD